MLVELSRGPIVESVHRISAVVVDAAGPVTTWEDGSQRVIARSSLKFLQVLPLLRTGAADRYSVTDDELILACASHSGEPRHIEAVRAWLHRIDLDESALECGPDRPIGAEALIQHHRESCQPASVLNCCSGKHAGFLTVAQHLGFDPVGYIEPDHPVQRLVTEAVQDLTGVSVDGQHPGRDGCGIPTFGIELAALADGMRKLVSPLELDAETAVAARRLVAAAPGREFWISGTDRHEVKLGRAATEPLLVKTGAEGVFMAGLPDRNVGIALKVHDGATRAADAAITAVLAELGAIDPQRSDGHGRAEQTLAEAQPVVNKAGVTVGSITVDLSSSRVDRR